MKKEQANIKCLKCQEIKSRDKFYESKLKSNHYVCKVCERKRVNRSRQKAAEYIAEYKKQHPCEHCGQDDYRVLEFDHIDPTTKKDKVSSLASYGLNAVKKEIAKCRVLCSYCHRRKNWNAERGIDSYE